jgi:phosphoribosyl 1,2-cyclic phosphodiesterase
MQLEIFATGSRGNSYILKDNEGRMLMLDCGISMQDVHRAVGFNPAALDACLVSHAHFDHLKSAKEMLKLYMPVYMSEPTAELGGIDMQSSTLRLIGASTTLRMGKWVVKPFETFHDADGSLGYLIRHVEEDINICYVTDTGYIQYVFPKLHILLTECNYVDEVIDDNKDEIGDRYLRLKETHLSLHRLKSYLSKVDKEYLRQIVLLHLSDSNSNAEQMQKELHEQTGVDVHIAEAGMTLKLDEFPF